jgi:pyruvate formate lyase activating enzyme
VRCAPAGLPPAGKKPLNHFLPGSAVLSSGTAGCNLGCRFCQNWDISTSGETGTLADEAAPSAIARAAAQLGCRSAAFT